MSVFSECLKKLIDKRDFNCAQVAAICNMDKSVLTHWYNGKYCPKEWAKIERIAEQLNFSLEEKRELLDCYEQFQLGDKYSVFRDIKEIIYRLQKTGEQSRRERQHITIGYIDTIPEYQLYDGKIEVLNCIEMLFFYMAGKEKKNLLLNMQTVTSEIWMLLRMFLDRVENCNIEMIVCSLEHHKDIENAGLKLLKKLAEVLVHKNQVQVWLGEKVEENPKLELNWILTDDFLFQFDTEFTQGMLTRDKELIAFYKGNFQQIQSSCQMLGKKSCPPLDIIMRMTNTKMTVDTLEFMPCLTFGLTPNILEECFFENLENRQNLIDAIMENYINARICKEGNFVGGNAAFSKVGLFEFMDTGIFALFPYKIYEPLSLEMRCEVLKNTISMMENGKYVQYLLKDEYYFNTKGIQIDLTRTDEIRLKINTFFTDTGERLEIINSAIQSQFGAYLEYFYHSPYVYSEEETLQFLKDVLENYRQGEHMEFGFEDWEKFYKNYSEKTTG